MSNLAFVPFLGFDHTRMARLHFLRCLKAWFIVAHSFVRLLRHVCRVARNHCNFSASRRRGSAELHHEGPGSTGSLLHQPRQPQAQDQNLVLQTGTHSKFNPSRIKPEAATAMAVNDLWRSFDRIIFYGWLKKVTPHISSIPNVWHHFCKWSSFARFWKIASDGNTLRT